MERRHNMADLSGSLRMLSNTNVWERAAYVLVGAAAPTVVENVAANVGSNGTPLPGEAYGAGTAVLMFWMVDSGSFRNYASAGSLAHTGFRAAERFDLVDTVQGLGA